MYELRNEKSFMPYEAVVWYIRPNLGLLVTENIVSCIDGV